jgi:hypothetical protein
VVPPAERPDHHGLGWVGKRPEVSLEDERERQRVLEDQLAQARRRIKMQQQIVDQVIGQRLALLEAAAQWRALLEANPSLNWEIYRRECPAHSDAERHCWRVIDAVKFKLRKEPERATAITGALEAELRSHLKQGTLHLPSRP